MALTAEIVGIEADAIKEICTEATELLSRVQRILEHNSDLSIAWTEAPKPGYISEDESGNLTGRNFSRAEVSNAIGSLDWIRKLLTNGDMSGSQGDHLGNLNKLARPLG